MVKFLLTIQNVSVNVKSRVKIWRAGIELLIMVLDLIIFSRAQLLRHVTCAKAGTQYVGL